MEIPVSILNLIVVVWVIIVAPMYVLIPSIIVVVTSVLNQEVVVLDRLPVIIKIILNVAAKSFNLNDIRGMIQILFNTAIVNLVIIKF